MENSNSKLKSQSSHDFAWTTASEISEKTAKHAKQGQQQIKGILKEEEHDQKPEQNLVLGRESNIDNSILTSFLVQEDSFLTPWNWSGNNKSEGKDDQNHSTSNSRIGEQQRLHLEPGSYFSYNVCEDALPYFFSVVVNRVTWLTCFHSCFHFAAVFSHAGHESTVESN